MAAVWWDVSHPCVWGRKRAATPTDWNSTWCIIFLMGNTWKFITDNSSRIATTGHWIAIYSEAYYHLSYSGWVTLEFLLIRPLKFHLLPSLWQGKESSYMLWLLMRAVEALFAPALQLFILAFYHCPMSIARRYWQSRFLKNGGATELQPSTAAAV